MAKIDIDVATIGREWALLDGEDCADWSVDDFEDHFYEAPWEPALEVSWKSGRVAGVKSCRGLHLAYDDANSYGPFTTFEEAEAMLDLRDDHDPIERCVVSPLAGLKPGGHR